MNATTLDKLNKTWLRRLSAVQLLLVLTVLFALSATNALAALIAYDPMNYTGSQINTGTASPTGTPDQTTGTGGGWTGNWQGGALTLNAFGQAYPSLPVAAKSLSQLGANTLYARIASAPTSGSVWVSFLFKQNADLGGNRCGIILENSSGTGIMFAYQQSGASQGFPCLMKMSGGTTVGAQLSPNSSTLRTYANTNLYVLEFAYSGGVVTTIRVYSNPTAGQNTAPSPDFTCSASLPVMGALDRFGTVNGIGAALTFDEFRVGDSFADVVGVSIIPVNVSITSPTNTQTVSIYNYTVSANATVVPGTITNVDFYVDATLVGNDTTSPFSFVVSGASAGAHALKAVATDSGGIMATSLVVNVTAANLSPSVTVTNPAGGSQILVGSSVSIGASATDDSAITNVDFYVDGGLVGGDNTSPYAAPWTATAGAHALTAVAYDNDGLSKTSAVVNVTGTLPTVSITSPTNTQTVSIYTYTVSANATVTPGTITNVDFYVDAALVGNDITSPFSYAVVGASAGAHTLQAVAWDSNGNSATSPVVNVTAANLSPSVTVTNPANASQILVGSSVSIGASATDDNSVTNVDFYVDGGLVGGDNTSPYAASWTATAGAHALTAVAYDNDGLSKTSAVVNVTGTLPVVSITSPTNTQTVSIYTYTVSANATVSPGTITNVDFYVDAALVGNDTTSPFSFIVSGASAGAHTVQAVAKDSNGNAATSTLVNVTAANLPPSVTVTNPAAASVFLIGASVSLGASAADDSAVTNVNFYVDGGLVGSDNTSPYAGTWSATVGAHALTAVAQDDAGLSTTSAVVNVTGVLNFNAYEPFNYGSIANGTNSTASGFSGNWTCGTTPSIVAGMTYTGLPVANSALSSASGRQFESFSGPMSNGTAYISFLLKASGNMGGNIDGVYFPNGGTSLFFGFGMAPNSGTQGGMGLGSMNTVGTAALGTIANLGSSFQGIYGTTYLIVMKIDFDTSGVNDTVTVYINPTANAAAPGVAGTYTNSSLNVGTITGIGLNVQGGATMTLDEIRRGSTYGEVVGYNPPATPTGLAATAGINSVSLSWNVASGATGYRVLRGISTGVYTVTNSVASNTNFDATAVGGTTYFYVVQATNSSGPSALSSEVTATPMIALPNVPNGVTATGTNSAVRLSWNTAVGATGYKVKRATTSGAEVPIASVGTTGYTDTAVVNGQQYFYKVSATNSTGESADSLEANATPNVPPAAPTALSATAGTNQVALSWTGSAGAVSYNIKRSTTSGSGYGTIGTTTAPTVAYTDLTAAKFTQYFYVVSAVNANGESSDSSEANATPLGTYGPVAYEPFNYSLGALANGTASTGTGFSGNWTVSGGGTIVAGLTYIGLTVANNALDSSGATHQYESLTSPQGSGSVWVSVLFQQNGDNGGNRDGFVMADAGGNGVEFAYQQFSGVQGKPALMAITGFFNYGGQLSPISSTPQTYNAANLYVFQLSYGGGALTNIAVYSNPTTGVNVPPSPDFTVSSGLSGIGALSVLGMAHQAGILITTDEWKVGQVYGDVVGYVVSTVNTSPTNIVSSVSGNQLTLSWPADHIGWKLQSQTNALSTGITATWYDMAGSTATNQMTFTIDPANPTVFYRMIYP